MWEALWANSSVTALRALRMDVNSENKLQTKGKENGKGNECFKNDIETDNVKRLGQIALKMTKFN